MARGGKRYVSKGNRGGKGHSRGVVTHGSGFRPLEQQADDYDDDNFVNASSSSGWFDTNGHRSNYTYQTIPAVPQDLIDILSQHKLL